MERVLVVGGALERNGRFLAARRGPGMSLAGKWEFPGGKVEEGESPEESLVRELREELGVEVAVGEFVARGDATKGDVQIVLDVYRCTIVVGDARPHEHDELRWMAPEDLPDLDWAVADLEAVAVLSSFPRGLKDG